MSDWNDFLVGDFLKVDLVENENEPFQVASIQTIDDADQKKLRLMVLKKGVEKPLIFDLNKTNTIFLKNEGLKSPEELVGKNIYFRQVMAHNPTTNKEVPSLRIAKIEYK